MDHFKNISSSVTNWWGSGNEKKEEKEAEGGGVQQESSNVHQLPSAEGGEPLPPKAGSFGGEEGEESPPTSEADTVSNRSETGDDGNPAENPEDETAEGEKGKAFGGIQVGINEVGSKAIESAKTFGSFLFSVANKAGKTVTETAKHIKHTVEENSLLGEFNKEQDAFVKEKNNLRTEAAVPPWVGYGEEEVLKQQILSLSQERRNFLRSPPSGVEFQFDFATMNPIAMATLAEDPDLEKIRFELVPKLVNEENFWKNYFYRVSLIKQSTRLSSLAQETGSIGDSSGRSSRKNSFEDGSKDRRPSGAEDVAPGSPITHEFASDAFQESALDREELRKGMKQLGMKDNEEEWEREVQQELQEFEVVMGASADGQAQVDDAEWEEEIQQMLEAEEMTSSATSASTKGDKV